MTPDPECLALSLREMSVLIKSEDHDFGLKKNREANRASRLVSISPGFLSVYSWHGGSLGWKHQEHPV